MEFNFNTRNPYSYMKYGGYRGEYKDNEYYMIPRPEASINTRDLYDVFSKIDTALVDLLNVGRLCSEDNSERMKFTSTLFFVQQYGLLGFMVEAPVNPNFLLDKEVILKKDNFISKKCVMKAQDYFDLFFPFANKEEISYSIVGNEIKINSKSDLQNLLNNTSITNQLIYSSFYCEKIDWIVDYAKKMYKIFKSIIDLQNDNLEIYSQERAREIITDYTMQGVPYNISMYGTKPEIAWQPNSLKQALDLAFGFFMCSDKNPIKMCKHCGNIFLSKNPKAEYCSPKCRNQANVYKSRAKNKE